MFVYCSTTPSYVESTGFGPAASGNVILLLAVAVLVPGRVQEGGETTYSENYISALFYVTPDNLINLNLDMGNSLACETPSIAASQLLY